MIQSQNLSYQTELINTKQMLDKVQELGIDTTNQRDRLDLLILQFKTTTYQESKQEKKSLQNLYILYQIQLELLEKYHTNFQKNMTFQTQLNKDSKAILNHERKNLECNKYMFEKELADLKKYNRKQLKRMIQKGVILTGYLSAITTLGVGGVFFAKHIATHKEYYTLEAIYNVNNDTITKQDYYEKTIKETIERIEYSNWNSPNLFEPRYQRNIEIYDISNFNYEDLKEYALLDMDLLNIEPQLSTETKYRLSDIDLYEESMIEIKRITHDQEKYRFTFDVVQFALIIWTELEITKMIYCYHLTKNYINNIPTRTPIKDLKQEYHELIYYKEKLELEKKKRSLLVTYLEKIESSKQKNSMKQEEKSNAKHLLKKKG